MTHRLAPLLFCASLACGGAQQPAASPPSATLVGHWHGELAGGPITGVMDYQFHADGTYVMSGYPSIAEEGHFALSGEGDARTLRFTERRRCGPCEQAGPTEHADDREVAATLSNDGSALGFDGWTFSRVQ